MTTEPTPAGRLLSTVEAADRLGITTREVYDRIESGELHAVRTEHGVKIQRDDVNAAYHLDRAQAQPPVECINPECDRPGTVELQVYGRPVGMACETCAAAVEVGRG